MSSRALTAGIVTASVATLALALVLAAVIGSCDESVTASGRTLVVDVLVRQPELALSGSETVDPRSPSSSSLTGTADAGLLAWAAEGPSAAAGFGLTLEDEEVRRRALLGVIAAWATRDPEAALAWASAATFASDYEREIIMTMACTTVARNDPRLALELGIAHGLATFANGAMGALVSSWAEADLVSATAWVAGRPPSPERDAWMASVALLIAEIEPTTADQWLTEQMPPGEARERTLFSLLFLLAPENPGLARDWARRALTGDALTRAEEQITALALRTHCGG